MPEPRFIAISKTRDGDTALVNVLYLIKVVPLIEKKKVVGATLIMDVADNVNTYQSIDEIAALLR